MNKNFKDNGSWFDDLFVLSEEATQEPLWVRQRSTPAKLITTGFTLATAVAPPSPVFYHSWGEASYINSLSALYAFGDGAYGLHMNPTATNESSIVVASTLVTWKDTALTDRFFVGVSTDNKLYSCGYRYYGSLGNGSYDPNITSIISQVDSAADWNYVSVGKKHTTLLKTNGALYATGNNTFGQLGVGTTTDISTPIQIGSSSAWTQITSGHEFNAGLNSGKIFTWGRNDYGQLGNGTTTNVSTPIQIGTADWVRISAKGYFWSAIKSDGSLWSCGGTISSPVQIGSSTDWIYNSQGFDIAAGIRGSSGSGALYAWTNGESPTQVGILENWTKVYCGNVTAAINTADQLFIWGPNSSGQLGLGNVNDITSPTQIAGSWTSFASSETSSLFVNKSGYLFGAGANWFGQLGFPPNTRLSAVTFIQGEISSLSGGRYHTVFTKTDGSLWAVGLNIYGQCGQPNLDEIYSAPVRIGRDSYWNEATCSKDASFVTASDGLFSFGRNDYGQLGLGDTVNRSSPTIVSPYSNWSIFPGEYVVLAVNGAVSGTLWGWGSNSSGQLGIGHTNSVSAPVQIGTENSWTFVGSNSYSTAAVKANGTLWGMGGIQYSIFGTWITTGVSTPVQLGSATNWRKVIAAPYEFQYLTTTGNLWTSRISPTLIMSGLGDSEYVAFGTTETSTNYIGYIP